MGNTKPPRRARREVQPRFNIVVNLEVVENKGKSPQVQQFTKFHTKYILYAEPTTMQNKNELLLNYYYYYYLLLLLCSIYNNLGVHRQAVNRGEPW
jgi:hypothetical protein